MLMYQGCSKAEENRDSCEKMDLNSAKDNGWTTELQKESTCIDTCEPRALLTDIINLPAPSSWLNYKNCV